MKVLIIGAHPDDEVYGCGGTIARLCNDNHEVHILIVTDGSSSQYTDKNMVRIKIEEASKVRKILGIKKYTFGDFPDMKLDTVPHVKLNKFIEKTVLEVKPEIIFTHYQYDLNKDHQKVFESTMVVSRPKNNFIKKIYSYEVPSTTELSSISFTPNKFVDITTVMEKKKFAVQAYGSELRDYPHARSLEAIEALSKYRGYSSSKKYAEAFLLIRETE